MRAFRLITRRARWRAAFRVERGEEVEQKKGEWGEKVANTVCSIISRAPDYTWWWRSPRACTEMKTKSFREAASLIIISKEKILNYTQLSVKLYSRTWLGIIMCNLKFNFKSKMHWKVNTKYYYLINNSNRIVTSNQLFHGHSYVYVCYKLIINPWNVWSQSPWKLQFSRPICSINNTLSH